LKTKNKKLEYLKKGIFLGQTTAILFLLFYFGTPCQVEAKNWEAKVSFINFNNQEIKKVEKAIIAIKEIIKSDDLENRIKHFMFNKKKIFHENDGLTNEEIYQKIIDAAEVLDNRDPDSIMEIELELFEYSSKTIGYTYPDTKRIWINKKYFSTYSIQQVANNLMHEWMHKLGFNHGANWDERRDYSVPYAVGNIFEDLIAKRFEHNQ
jgi:hypothetical protein